MLNLALMLTATTALLAQAAPANRATPKVALDLNVECVSLLGTNFYRTPAEGEALEALERRLAEVNRNAQTQPDNPAAHMALGQALEALWRYRDAAQAFPRAMYARYSPSTGILNRPVSL